MSRRERLPTGNLSLARLTRSDGRVQGLLNGLVDRLRIQLQQRSDASSRCRADMSDVVNFMLVKANAFHQVHLDFIAGCNTTQQVVTVLSALLSNSQQGRDVVARVRVISCQERVVEVEFADGSPVGPRGPLSTNAMAGR